MSRMYVQQCSWVRWGSTAWQARLASTLLWPQPPWFHSVGSPAVCWCGSNGTPNLCVLEERIREQWHSLFTAENICCYCSFPCWRLERIVKNDSGYIEGHCHNHWVSLPKMCHVQSPWNELSALVTLQALSAPYLSTFSSLVLCDVFAG